MGVFMWVFGINDFSGTVFKIKTILYGIIVKSKMAANMVAASI